MFITNIAVGKGLFEGTVQALLAYASLPLGSGDDSGLLLPPTPEAAKMTYNSSAAKRGADKDEGNAGETKRFFQVADGLGRGCDIQVSFVLLKRAAALQFGATCRP